MNVTQHKAAMVAAIAAVEAAEVAKAAVEVAAVLELSPVKVGEEVPGKISMSGTPCKMKVISIDARIGSQHITLHVSGKKLNKDGSVSHTDAYAFISVMEEEEV